MTQPKTITVYCGSRPGKRKEYAQFAAEFGSRLGREGYAMLFGGGRLGLMGIRCYGDRYNSGSIR